MTLTPPMTAYPAVLLKMMMIHVVMVIQIFFDYSTDDSDVDNCASVLLQPYRVKCLAAIVTGNK